MSSKSVDILVDTSAFLDVLLPAQPNRERARQKLEDMLDKHLALATTTHVVGETVSILRRRIGVAAGDEFLQLLANAKVKIIYQTESHYQRILALLRKHDGRSISFTDCSLVVAAQTYGVQMIFSYDKDFMALGITTLG